MILVLTTKDMGDQKISFEEYNESTYLNEAIERFKERTGYIILNVFW